MNTDSLAQLRSTASHVPTLAEMFAASPDRANEFSCDAVGLHFDYSRQRLTSELFVELVEFAQEAGVPSKIASMFSGELVNNTEGRPALHTALRATPSSSSEAAWASKELQRALTCAQRLRELPEIHAVVNIGIGGSDLGPAMATKALRVFRDGAIRTIRFVSNVDAADLDEALDGLQPRHTVFIVSSKTFTTSETMHNAARARRWMTDAGVSWDDHFYASTARPSEAIAWGIKQEHCFEFKDWVGGRFSISSVIGLPLVCAIGPEAFVEFLEGMRDMDQHVVSTTGADNIALVHALVWFANAAVHEYSTVAVVPYSHDLARLPAYLQQLLMESNGKSVQTGGGVVGTPTSPVVWGEPGTNGQHAFFQMLHQGTQVVPVEFIGVAQRLGTDQDAHDILIANMVAQSEALAVGSSNSNPHQNFPGNRPSSVLLMDELSPRMLGALLSMYEHSTAIQGWLFGVNSFDQFGVELGKTIASRVLTSINNAAATNGLTVTHPLLERYLAKRKNNSAS